MAGKGGGAWKVAYADFVTTMMALFMVLWISQQDKKILIATSRYFQNPFRSPMEDHSGVMPFNKEDTSHNDDTNDKSKAKTEQPQKEINISYLNAVAADFYRLLHVDSDLEKKPVDVQVTSDGLRVTLFDRANRPLFDENGSQLTEWGKFVMQNLAWLIDRHGMHVTIDGHTRSHLKLPNPAYSAWELSADRANAARRSLIYYAVSPQMIERVSGYADTRPVIGEPLDSETNQRITLSLALSAKRDDEARPVALPPLAPLASPPPSSSSN